MRFFWVSTGVLRVETSCCSSLVTALRGSAGQLSGGRTAARFRTGLVTAQIALSIVLLTCAGLFVKSLHNVSQVDLGLNAENVATFGISPRLSGYDTTGATALVERARDALGEVAHIPCGQIQSSRAMLLMRAVASNFPTSGEVASSRRFFATTLNFLVSFW